MKDYEVLRIPNGKKPNMGLLHLTVSENRVGLRFPVLDAIGRPDGIVIHRGVRANEGRLIIEAAEYDEENPRDEVIFIDYERKKIDFYNQDFVESCKNMIRKYSKGDFSRGVFFTVKGIQESETTIMFDFRVVTSRVVTAVLKPKKRAANGKIVGKHASSVSKTSHSKMRQGESEQRDISNDGQNQQFGRFTMPTMGRSF